MPGRGSYGPGGKWIYQRAKNLRAKNPDMEESTSFAIATQQAHKVGKSPKGFRTAEGVQTAKNKMTGPVKEYRKTAMIAGFFDELEKVAVSQKAKAKYRERRRAAKAATNARRAEDTARKQQARAARQPPPPPKAPPRSTPRPGPSVKSAPRPGPKPVSGLRRYGLKAGAGVLGAAALGGLVYAAHKREKRDKKDIDKFFSKSAESLFDEIAKIAQGRAGGDLKSMATQGFGTGAAPSDAPGPASASDFGGGSPAPPPSPSPGGGASSSASMGVPGSEPPGGGGTPSASDLGIPSGGNPMGGGGGSASAVAPPPPAQNPASLIGRKGPSTGKMTSAESAEISGSGKGGGLTSSDLGI